MTIKEIAKRVGVSVSTISVWIKKGNLKPEKKAIDRPPYTRAYAFTENDVEVALKLKRTQYGTMRITAQGITDEVKLD